MKFQKKLLAASISAALASSATTTLAAFDDPGTDYSEAHQSTHMWTPGMEALDSVNNILCFIDQLRAGDMVNQGVYTALVDEKKCEAGDSGDTRDKGPSQQFVVVESTRADDNSPQKAKIWIPGMGGPGDGPVLVKAFASISAEPTEDDPLQDFTMKFEMFSEDTDEKVGEGYIQATPSSELAEGKIGIKFFEEMDVTTPMGDEVFISAANVIKNPDGSDGVAITRSIDWHGEEEGPADKYYGLSWNEATVADRVKIQEGDDATNNSDLDGQEACLAKDELKTAVWDYGVYAKTDLTLGSTNFTAGQEISLNSGFPIVYGEDGESHGFIGYWGIWTDDGTTPTSGVQKVDYSTNPPTKTDIDITAAPGKLWKNTLKNISLDEIAGVEFEYGVFEGGEEYMGDGGGEYQEHPPMEEGGEHQEHPPMEEGGEHPPMEESSLEGEFKQFSFEVMNDEGGEGEGEGEHHGDGGHGGWTNYIIKYVAGDGENNGTFVKTHTVEHGENGPEKTALPDGEETLDLSNESMLWLWSQQLGGSVTVAISEGQATDLVIAERTQVTQADDMFGDADANITLNCYNRCPRSDIGTDDLQGWEGEGSPYLDDQNDTSSSHSYTISRTDMALKLNGTNVAFASTVSESDLEGSNYQWGVNSGLLIPSSETITDLIQLHDGSIETWYEWETGIQSWNQYIIASENGSPLVFDEPLKFTMTYDHEAMARAGADQGEDYDNQTFLLEYGGEGQLWGFPMIEAGDDHYYPAIALADGTTISDSANEYVVKAWHMEQKMESVANNECSDLHLGDVPGGIPSEMNSELTSNTDDIPEGAEELTPSVVNGVVKIELE